MSTEPRLVIYRWVRHGSRGHELTPLVNLPDAEHIHLTRHADGTVTAVPMARPSVGNRPERALWVDVEGGAA